MYKYQCNVTYPKYYYQVRVNIIFNIQNISEEQFFITKHENIEITMTSYFRNLKPYNIFGMVNLL